MMMNVISSQPRSHDATQRARRRAPWFPTHIDPQTKKSQDLKSNFLHILLARSRRFERSLMKFEKVPIAAPSLDCLFLKMNAIWSFETSGNHLPNDTA
jgi:hypothetical protein